LQCFGPLSLLGFPELNIMAEFSSFW
jgi:hypothetical protein